MNKIKCIVDQDMNIVVVSEIAAIKRENDNYVFTLKSGAEVTMQEGDSEGESQDMTVWPQIAMHFLES